MLDSPHLLRRTARGSHRLATTRGYSTGPVYRGSDATPGPYVLGFLGFLGTSFPARFVFADLDRTHQRKVVKRHIDHKFDMLDIKVDHKFDMLNRMVVYEFQNIDKNLKSGADRARRRSEHHYEMLVNKLRPLAHDRIEGKLDRTEGRLTSRLDRLESHLRKVPEELAAHETRSAALLRKNFHQKQEKAVKAETDAWSWRNSSERLV
ncbi:hypothetical protein JCM10450v2_002053 [Rhodotorula kratochvilovae]